MTYAPGPVSKGVSPVRVAGDIARCGPKFHRSTMCRWMAAYGPLTEGCAGKIRPWKGTGDTVTRSASGYWANGACLFTVMDHPPGFVLSYVASPVKMGAEPSEMFGEAARGAGTAPRVFVTDGMVAERLLREYKFRSN